MPHADFVHLRVHSAYSLLEGAIKVKELVTLCAGNAMPAVAISDTANLFGQLEFALAASGAGVQPIPAVILPVERPDADPAPQRAGRPARPDRLLLIAQDRTGWENLMALVSEAYLETEAGDEAHVGWDAFENRTAGVICLTGGPEGPVGRLLAEGQGEAAGRVLSTLERLFPGRLYVELMRHGLEVEDRIEPKLIDLAYARDLPLVATNDCFFADGSMYEAHDALLCIAEGSYVIQDDRRRVTPEHRFKTAAEMRALFDDLPEACDNTLTIARRCAFMVEKHPPILPAFDTAGGRSEVEELRAQAAEGLERRLETHVHAPGIAEAERERLAAPYRERLDYELSVIEKMGFPGYFLIVSDFIKWAKAQGIPVGPGRGSGAGSVVAWALTITDLDPMRFGLLFERFLNPERVSMPDFDVDFCQDRRDEVIEYVRDKYGHDKVAQIITFGTLQARAALRDVGRVLQLPYPEVDRICKLVPNNPANPVTLQQALDIEPQLREARKSDARIGRMIDIALKIEGLYRHASTHAAGVVIGDRPLAELVPLYRDPRSPMPVTQFNMKYVEQAGPGEVRLPRSKTLTVAVPGAAFDLIRRPEGGAGAGRRSPGDDPARRPGDLREMLVLGRGPPGLFQLGNTPGMRGWLRQLKPNRFRVGTIIALVAPLPPGAMDNIPEPISRVKNGQPEAGLPFTRRCSPILEETFRDHDFYQEQLMQVAQEWRGYTLGAADLRMRRAMGKRSRRRWRPRTKGSSLEGAVGPRRGRRTKASRIFDQVREVRRLRLKQGAMRPPMPLVAYQDRVPEGELCRSVVLPRRRSDPRPRLHRQSSTTFKQETRPP